MGDSIARPVPEGNGLPFPMQHQRPSFEELEFWVRQRTAAKHHTVVGREIPGSSDRPLLRAASVIAFKHHERWNGKGYPLGKAGLDISLSGRIVSLCDVFDALYNKRVYKEAWPLEKVLDLFRAEK